jgi:transposase-like protein
MRTESFEQLKVRLARELTAEQCMALITLLQKQAHERLGEVVLQRRTEVISETPRCVYCGNTDIVRHGRDENRRQRFRCRRTGDVGCGRTFNALTGTVLARMRHPGKWVAYATEMADHKSVAEIANGGIGVSRLTVWRWRQKLLKVQTNRPFPRLRGVVEADETFFRTSYKGSRGWKRGTPPENRPPRYRGGASKRGLSAEQVPVLTAVDQSGGVFEWLMRSRADIERTLERRIEPGSVLCSDGLSAYKAVAVRCQSEHRRILPPRKPDPAQQKAGRGPRKRGRLGLGRVNSHHQRLKTFINRRANGVSTKYLPSYLGWIRAIRRPGFSTSDFLTDVIIHS